MNKGKPVLRKKISRKSLLLSVCALLVAGVLAFGAVAYRDQVEEFSGLGYLGAYLIMVVNNATVGVPIPGFVFVAAMSREFNPWILILAGGLGSATGEFTSYFAGYGGRHLVKRSKLFKKMRGWMRAHGELVLLVLSALPNPFTDVAAALAGASRMKWWRFFVAVAVGKTIQTAYMVWLSIYSIDWVLANMDRFL